MQDIPQEQVQQAAQHLLTLLDSPSTNIPGNLLEGVFSGKSLLRALLNGTLKVVATGKTMNPAADPKGDPKKDPEEEPEGEDPKP